MSCLFKVSSGIKLSFNLIQNQFWLRDHILCLFISFMSRKKHAIWCRLKFFNRSFRSNFLSCLFTTKLAAIELILVGESELFTWGGEFGELCGGCHLYTKGDISWLSKLAYISFMYFWTASICVCFVSNNWLCPI